MTENNPMTVGELRRELAMWHANFPISIIYKNPPSFPMESCKGYLKKIVLEDTGEEDQWECAFIVENPAHSS